MTCRGHCAVSRGYTLFRQKNIRTKEYIEKQTHVQASLTFVSLFYVLHLRMRIAQLFFWWKEQMCNILQLVSSSSFLAGTRNLVIVVCMWPRQHCAVHEDKIPGPSQGWRVASIAQFSCAYLLLDIRTKEQKWCIKVWKLQQIICYAFLYLCICIGDATTFGFFCWKEQKVYNIAWLSIQSFLAGTRNPIMMFGTWSRWHCTVH